MFKVPTIAIALIAVTVAACDKKVASVPQPRPVRTVTVEHHIEGEAVSQTGQIRAKDEVSLAFRLDGRVIERLVRVGDVVKPGQVVARLDPKDEQNALRTARATLGSDEAIMAETQKTLGRQRELLDKGWTPQAQFDKAEQAFLSAQAAVSAAQAQVRLTQDQVSYTVLSADAPGAVTAVGAEPGEVVHAGQMVVHLAREGGRDAVFDVAEEIIRTGPRDPVVELNLTNDPNVKAVGRVREVAPQADPNTRTFQVKVGIIDPPEAMRLGSTVTGRIKLAAPLGVEIPASALTEANGNPAVWVVNPQTQTVLLRNVAVLRYTPASVVVSQGLQEGEIVVTAGVQMLHPDQKVRL
jgi:membrane fusion protein, multidrug efflux system